MVKITPGKTLNCFNKNPKKKPVLNPKFKLFENLSFQVTINWTISIKIYSKAFSKQKTKDLKPYPLWKNLEITASWSLSSQKRGTGIKPEWNIKKSPFEKILKKSIALFYALSLFDTMMCHFKISQGKIQNAWISMNKGKVIGIINKNMLCIIHKGDRSTHFCSIV